MSLFEAPVVTTFSKRKISPFEAKETTDAFEDEAEDLSSDEAISGEDTASRYSAAPAQIPADRRHRSLRYQHLDVLVTMTHRFVLDHQWERAHRAYSMLLRCKGVDIRLCYGLGIVILDHIDQSGIKTEEFLGRLIVAYPPLKPRQGKRNFDRADIFVRILTKHRMSHKRHKEALDDLEGWLLIPPYKDDPELWQAVVTICGSLRKDAQKAGDKNEARVLKTKQDKASAHLSDREAERMDVDE